MTSEGWTSKRIVSSGFPLLSIVPWLQLFLVVALFSSPTPIRAATLYRYAKSGYGQGRLTDPLPVPPGTDATAHLADNMRFEKWTSRREGNIIFLAENPQKGKIPILSLHKLGMNDRYELSPQRLETLLRYLLHNRWYLISDRQYLEGDLTRVPTGFKPLVMGADDASYGSLIYRTRGNPLTSPVLRRLGAPLLDGFSMVAILEKLVPREEGRINFTFYVSFDAIPFRQLDGIMDPGFPYIGIPVVAEKILYLDQNFLLGLHSLSHIYASKMPESDFIHDVASGWEILNDYAGGQASTVTSFTFPYGILDLETPLHRELMDLEILGQSLMGTFTLDNRLSVPPGLRDPQKVASRIGVDNASWDNLMSILRSSSVMTAQRLVILESEEKRIPRSRFRLGVKKSDPIWVLVSN